MRWGVIAIVAGCYDPTVEAGGACDIGCPAGFVCVGGTCREPGFVSDAPPDGDDNVDTDRDGLVDAVDNCVAVANADQHDEDGDELGDVCDPCPHVAGTAADGDGDGVGDACDPQPQLPDQKIAFFDPFASELPAWEGSATVTEDTLELGNNDFARLTVANGESRIATGGTIVAVDALGSPHQLSIEFGANDARDELHLVQFFDSTGNSGDVSIVEKIGNTFADLASTPYAGTLPAGAWALRIDGSVAAQKIELASTLGGAEMPAIGTSTEGAPPLRAGANINLFVRNAVIRLDYMIVIETSP